MESLIEQPLYVLVGPLYFAFMIYEVFVGRRRKVSIYESRDTAVSLGTSLIAAHERILTGAVYGTLLFFFYQFRIFEIEITWYAVLICLFLDDFCYYWKHRIEHRVRWAWASHVVHHSSQHLNYAVALRQTWTFLFTGLIVIWIPLALLGFHPLVIGFCASLNLIYQFFLHTETIKKLPKWFEGIMNTPSHHRVHHATNPKYLDANYAGIFIIWDKLFGTYVPEDVEEPCRYGIIRNVNTFNLFIVSFHEWIAMLKDVFQPAISLKERLCYMFMPPGWSHSGNHQTTESIKRLHVHLNPETAGQAGLPPLTPQEVVA